MIQPIKKQLELFNTEILGMMNWTPHPTGPKYTIKLQLTSTFSNEQDAENSIKNLIKEIEIFVNNNFLNSNKTENKLLNSNNNNSDTLSLVAKGIIEIDGIKYEPRIVNGIVLGSINDELKDYRTFEETYLPIVHRNHLEITQADIPQARVTIQEDGNPFTIVTEHLDLNSLPPELRPAIAPRDSRYGKVLEKDIEQNELNPNTIEDYFEGRPLTVPKYSNNLKFKKDKKGLSENLDDITLNSEEIKKLLDLNNKEEKKLN